MQREALLGSATAERTSLLESNKRSLGENQDTWAEDILDHSADSRHMSEISQDEASPVQGEELPPQLIQK